MSTIADVEFDPGVFLLGVIFERFPGATIELERIVPTGEAVIPYFWVRGVSETEAGTLGRNLPDETVVERVDSIDDEHLVRATWDPVVRRGILQGMIESGLTLVSAVGTADGWRFELRGDEHESITRFQAYCREHDIPLRLTGIHTLGPVRGGDYGLTDKQREALVLAHERGFYDSPREADLEEIAAELGISRQALASRLRRGTRRLLEATVATE
jgi:predicted DNA binding protein